MKKITIEKKNEIDALTDDREPNSSWTLALKGNLQDYDKSLNGLLKLRQAVVDNPELFNGEMPKHYVALAEKFIALTDILKNAFGE